MIIVNQNSYSNIHYAYFAKPKSQSSGVNELKDSLSISPIQTGTYVERNTEDVYFRRIRNILKNPKVESVMILPISVFQSFEFDNFIYLNHMGIHGYFYVDKIDNYKDGASTVKVYLLYID